MQRAALLLTLVLFSYAAKAQLGQDSTNRVPNPAVPFLIITPDARSGAIGDAGGAISPDAASIHWNPGKLAFVEQAYGGSVSYTPWLGKIVNDMAIVYLGGFAKLDDVQAVGASLRYFDLGEITFTDINGQIIRPYNPQEYAIDLSYSRKLSDRLGIGIAGRFIQSNLAGDGSINNFDTRPGRSVAADVGLYYRNPDFVFAGKPGEFALAAVISNIGGKITYLDESTENFLPGNLRLAGAYTANLDAFNKITLAVDLNKLLVPTPPIYEFNEDGTPRIDSNGDRVIEAGKDPNRSLLSGTFGSFGDAPDGFSEELQEITVSTGLEYWYRDLFAARGGFFYEHPDKGGRQYFTMGVGLRYQIFAFDFAYLLPSQRNHPLAETLRFTLALNFDRNTQTQTPTAE